MLHIEVCNLHLRAFPVVIGESPFLHGGIGKSLAFQVLHGIKVLSALFGGFTLQTLGFLAVTFCRVAVTPKRGGLLFREVGFFRGAALAAVKQPVLACVVLRLCGSSHHIQNGIGKKFSHKLSPSLKV